MIKLFKSKIFLRQFLYIFMIICLTFLTISSIMLFVTRISLERQQTNAANNFHNQVSQAIESWFTSKECDVISQSLYLGQLGEDKLYSREVQNILEKQLYWDDSCLDILILNNKGEIINSADTLAKPSKFDCKYLVYASGGRRSYAGFFEIPDINSQAMIIAVPISTNNQSDYLLATVINMNTVKQLVEKQDFGGTGHAYLIDDKGNFITGSSFLGNYIKKSGIKRINSKAVESLLSNTPGTGSYTDFMGQKVFGSYKWINSINAGLIVEFYTSSVLSPIYTLLRVVGILSILVTILGGFFAAILSSKIIKPTELLINATGSIISHNYEEPIKVKTNTELDILIDRFNNMQSAIRSREEELKSMNEELKIQTREAKEANMLKDEFLANVSHELKTPLNSIIGFTNRVIKKSGELLPQTQYENLTIVRNQSEHLSELIDGILDYSKLQAGQLEVNLMHFDLNDVINEIDKIVPDFKDEKPIDYEKHFFCSSGMLMYSDRYKVKQIIKNLISNAFKYSNNGVVKLSIDKKDCFYRIIVEDNGIGIEPYNLKKIFKPFVQLDGSSTRKAGGTGLGLSLTKYYCELLGGKIEVKSTPGTGSCFTVYIPNEYNKQNTV